MPQEPLPACCSVPQGYQFWSDSTLGMGPLSLPPPEYRAKAFSGRLLGPNQRAAPCLVALNFGLTVRRGWACVLGSPNNEPRLFFSGRPTGPRQHAAPCLWALNFGLTVHGAWAHILDTPEYCAKATFLGYHRALASTLLHASGPQFWSESMRGASQPSQSPTPEYRA